MPSAAKLVKQASTEAPDPLRQGVTIIEHKIRNLEKRKVKLESYRALQNEGKDLQPEQLAAVAKYDEVIQTLEFARDLCKQFNSISADNAKAAKRQARKEALERQANDLARIKDVLLFQNVLNQIGTDAVREDFLNGTNGATKLTETDLQLFDTFYETVTPKSYDDAKISVDDQLVAAADHYLSAIDGKSKEFAGVTYTVLKEKISSVHACGYFDKPSVEPASEAPVEAVEAQVEELQAEVPVEESVPVPEVVNPTFQAPQGQPPQSELPIQQPPQPTPDGGLYYTNVNPAAVYSDAALPVPQHQIPVQPQVQVPLRPHDVINSVTSGTFNFLQESELDSPDPSLPQPSHQMPPSAIPTQTFTNQNFPGQVNPPPASAVPMFHPQHQPPPHIQPVHTLPGENFSAANQNALPIPQSHLPPVSPPNAGNPPPGMPYQQQMYSPHSDRYDQSRNEHVNDNHVDSSQAEQTTQSTPPQNINNKWPNDTDDWNNQNNDDWNSQNQNEWSQTSNNNDGGYQTQRRDRGDRDQRGRGKPRGTFNGYGGRGRGGNDRPYQNDRQQGGYYRNNNGEGGTFYQNGYNKDGQGGYRGGRGGGMDRPRPNRGGMDRGGPRGGPRGNSRGRGGGGFRGGQSGQGVPTGGPGPKQ
ncbi:caprin homolog isoform X1 [Frankliniella occidentalis]|uniref:Caprin homolog isoform X1 n=1 Tax=Frankliniella occidentalis TaxID=133901 RepID=A0A9C6X4M0_FRAOC|nr:caprin homolog isoform X1 [Frankliniella occidentalis]